MLVPLKIVKISLSARSLEWTTSFIFGHGNMVQVLLIVSDAYEQNSSSSSELTLEGELREL